MTDLRKPLKDHAAIMQFMLAGNATFTLVSEKTGTRFTYRVREPEENNGKAIFFVSALTSPDNEDGYRYLGLIREYIGALKFSFANPAKAKIAATAPCAKAFAWAIEALLGGRLPAQLQVWHEGRCGRCNRKLTVPESISTGFGPECRKGGFLAEAA